MTMNDATVSFSDKGPLILASYRGIAAHTRCIVSPWPDRIQKLRPSRDIYAVTFCGISRFSPAVCEWSDDKLARLIAHEWVHARRERKMGRADHAFTYVFKHEELERDADLFDDAYWPHFVAATKRIRAFGYFRPARAA